MKSSAAEIVRQATATAARPLWTLPVAWYEPGCDERMAQWIRRTRPTTSSPLAGAA